MCVYARFSSFVLRMGVTPRAREVKCFLETIGVIGKLHTSSFYALDMTYRLYDESKGNLY